MARNLLLLVGAMIFFVLVLAACGGGADAESDSSSSSGAPQFEKDEKLSREYWEKSNVYVSYPSSWSVSRRDPSGVLFEHESESESSISIRLGNFFPPSWDKSCSISIVETLYNYVLCYRDHFLSEGGTDAEIFTFNSTYFDQLYGIELMWKPDEKWFLVLGPDSETVAFEFKLVGPPESYNDYRDEFEKMVFSLRPGDLD